MDFNMFFLLGLIPVYLVLWRWAMICINRTSSERSKMIAYVFDKNQPNYPFTTRRLDELDAVSFKQHLWAKIIFKDLNKLYPNLAKEALK